MPVTDYGLLQIGSFIKGESPGNIVAGVIGSDGQTISSSKSHLGSEILRSAVTWQWKGNDPQGTFIILPSQANGSTIQEVGFATSTTALGSDLWARELSAIGDKDASFSVSINFLWRSRRV